MLKLYIITNILEVSAIEFNIDIAYLLSRNLSYINVPKEKTLYFLNCTFINQRFSIEEPIQNF